MVDSLKKHWAEGKVTAAQVQEYAAGAEAQGAQNTQSAQRTERAKRATLATGAKNTDECWTDGVDYYDEAECCGAGGLYCDPSTTEYASSAWLWCEKSEPVDPCEGSCFAGGKKNGGGFFEVDH